MNIDLPDEWADGPKWSYLAQPVVSRGDPIREGPVTYVPHDKVESIDVTLRDPSGLMQTYRVPSYGELQTDRGRVLLLVFPVEE